MKCKAFILALFALFIASCSNDDDKNESLNGTWKLKNATVTEGASINYSDNEVLWTFNQNTNRLTVENKVITQGPENVYSGLPSGIYSFSISYSGSSKTLYIQGYKEGVFALTNDNLVISTLPESQNGLTKVFSR